jgi:type I restriction enzyme S subunit
MPNGDAMSLPNGWETKEIGDVLSLEYGKPLPKEKRTPNGLYPVYGANGIKDRTNEFYVEEPSIIVGRKGSAGEINYTEDKFWPLDVTYFTKFDKSELNLDFLFHLLTLLELPKLAKGVKPGINRNDVYAIKTKIPPLDEQKRIVAKLDECFEAIHIARTNVEKNLSNAKELFQSQLNQIFASTGSATDGDSPELAEGWEEKKLGEVTYVKSGGTPLRSNKEFWDNGDIPWYSSGELNNLYTNESERHITQIGLENSNAKLFPEGSLLIGMYDTAALKMSILDRGATFNQAIAGVKPSRNINLLFIFYSINAMKSELLNQRRGVRQKNLSLKKIKDFIISFPSLDVQKRVVEELGQFIIETQSLESNYQQELDALDELKKSILQKAFNGELTIDNG